MILFIIAITLEIRQWARSRPISLLTDAEIKDYMYKWISRGGRVAIFSRDLSWAVGPEIRTLLSEKARRNELRVCLPENIPSVAGLVNELERAGAEVCLYPELHYTPHSRFTIINKDRMDAQVAVGRRIK
ncbi:MAG: hypothetical protein ACREIS_01225, partial [Nitrospiraceae bacterium]